MESEQMHHLGREAIHTFWDNSLPPQLTIAPGDTNVFETLEPSRGAVALDVDTGTSQIEAAPDLIAVINASVYPEPPPQPATELRGHALTGPVAIAGAEPCDTVVVDVVQVIPAAWGWTACGPGEGGGPLQDEMEECVLHVWDLRDGDAALFAPGIRVPMAPFCGVKSVASDEPRRHPTIPPRSVGGNLDVRQLTAGASLSLPVMVPGALFSVGDVHAAQGDGEVAGTGIETDATVTLRFSMIKGRTISGPQFRTPTISPTAGPWFAATGHAPDLCEASREALRGILSYFEEHHGLARPRACIIASPCVDLHISQIVNGGVFMVSAFLRLSIFN